MFNLITSVLGGVVIAVMVWIAAPMPHALWATPLAFVLGCFVAYAMITDDTDDAETRARQRGFNAGYWYRNGRDGGDC